MVRYPDDFFVLVHLTFLTKVLLNNIDLLHIIYIFFIFPNWFDGREKACYTYGVSKYLLYG